MDYTVWSNPRYSLVTLALNRLGTLFSLGTRMLQSDILNETHPTRYHHPQDTDSYEAPNAQKTALPGIETLICIVLTREMHGDRDLGPVGDFPHLEL